MGFYIYMFGTLEITQLLITSTTISFLSTAFVISEVFCGDSYQYSHAFAYFRTFVEHSIPIGTKRCIIRNFDGINTFIKIIKIE